MGGAPSDVTLAAVRCVGVVCESDVLQSAIPPACADRCRGAAAGGACACDVLHSSAALARGMCRGALGGHMRKSSVVRFADARHAVLGLAERARAAPHATPAGTVPLRHRLAIGRTPPRRIGDGRMPRSSAADPLRCGTRRTGRAVVRGELRWWSRAAIQLQRPAPRCAALRCAVLHAAAARRTQAGRRRRDRRVHPPARRCAARGARLGPSRAALGVAAARHGRSSEEYRRPSPDLRRLP